MMTRADIIALAVATGTPKATAEANYDAAFPPPPAPGANDVMGGGEELRGNGRYRITFYADGRRTAVKIS